MQIQKRILTMTVMIMTLFLASTVAYAYDVLNLDQKGSIQIDMFYEDEIITEGSLTLYHIASVINNDEHYMFNATEDFQDYEGSLENIQSLQLASDLNEYRINHHISGVIHENVHGRITFTDLKVGLYLIVQDGDTHGYTMDPFLVSVPMEDNGVYIYEVNASPKVEIKKDSSFEEPTEPRLPQTGQLNWPIPLLVVSGLMTFTMGWLLCLKKRDCHL